MKPWYELSFQEDYLRIYAHRGESQAGRELEKLLTYIPIKTGQKVLDLCCGQGRHSRWLAQQGFQVVGVDLSAALLHEAIKNTLDLPVQYMRSDARRIRFYEEMNLVVNLFTSFGYFAEDEENEKVLYAVSRALKPGGYFLLDFINPDFLKSNLEPFTRTVMENMEVLQYRSLTEEYVQKRIVIKEDEMEKSYHEQVKLYGFKELIPMLERNHLHVQCMFGNYDASGFDASASPRMIFICKKDKKQ